MAAINTRAFEELIIKKYGSVRAFAPRMLNSRGTTMDTSSMYKLLKGVKSMAWSEAVQMKKLLGLSWAQFERLAGDGFPGER